MGMRRRSATVPVAVLGVAWGCSGPTTPSGDKSQSNASPGATPATGDGSPVAVDAGVASPGAAVDGAVAGSSVPAGDAAASPTPVAGDAAVTPVPVDGTTTVTPPADTLPEPCSDLYDEALLPTFDVEISETEWNAMARDCEDEVQEYRPIVFRYSSETVDAMMRLKGNWSWDCDKMQLVISFNSVDPDARFHGLRKIVLDAPWCDPTLLHERLAFFYLQRYGAPFGLPYSCVNNARLLPELAQADPISYEHPEWLREGQYCAVPSDPTWCQAYEAALVEARAAYDVDLLTLKVNTWAEQIATALAEDPNKTFTMEEAQAQLESFRTFPARCAAAVDAWRQAGSHCPPEWPATTTRPRPF